MNDRKSITLKENYIITILKHNFRNSKITKKQKLQKAKNTITE